MVVVKPKTKKVENGLGGRFVIWARTSVWLYPAILLVIFVLFTTFKISGSSVGVYYEDLYGSQAKDPSLLVGVPKHVRADEWQDTTPLTVAQAQNDYHKFNPNIGTGHELALQNDVPFKDWTSMFRPHTWGFYLFGLERGFAFKWWLPMLLLLIGAYFFVLRILPGRKKIAALISLAIGLSPFLLWWYQTAAIGTMAYAFLIMILVQRLLEAEPVRFLKNDRYAPAAQALALGYLLICFGLDFYPPFQISVGLVVIFYTLGYLAKKIFTDKVKSVVVLKRLGWIAGGVVLAGIAGVIFVLDNHAQIHALSGSLYPGKRVTHSGELSWLYMFNGYLMPLQEQNVHLFRNLSEASNFIFTLPFLLLPGYFLLVYEYLKQKKIDWVFLAIQLCATLFMLRGFIHFGDSLYKPLLLNRVPGARLLIGLGLVGVIQFAFVLKKVREIKLSFWKYYGSVVVYGLICLIGLVLVTVYVHHHHEKVFSNKTLMVFSALWFWLIIVLALAKKQLLAAAALFGFSLFSSFYVVPLYKGLGILDNSQLVQDMQRVSKPSDTWVTVDSLTYENMGLVAGRHNLSGEQIYVDKTLWSQVGGQKFEQVYNRKAHVMFTTTHVPADLYLVKANLFEVKFYCSPFILQHVNYALSLKPISLSCAKLVDTVKYPKNTFYLYKVSG